MVLSTRQLFTVKNSDGFFTEAGLHAIGLQAHHPHVAPKHSDEPSPNSLRSTVMLFGSFNVGRAEQHMLAEYKYYIDITTADGPSTMGPYTQQQWDKIDLLATVNCKDISEWKARTTGWQILEQMPNGFVRVSAAGHTLDEIAELEAGLRWLHWLVSDGSFDAPMNGRDLNSKWSVATEKHKDAFRKWKKKHPNSQPPYILRKHIDLYDDLGDRIISFMSHPIIRRRIELLFRDQDTQEITRYHNPVFTVEGTYDTSNRRWLGTRPKPESIHTPIGAPRHEFDAWQRMLTVTEAFHRVASWNTYDFADDEAAAGNPKRGRARKQQGMTQIPVDTRPAHELARDRLAHAIDLVHALLGHRPNNHKGTPWKYYPIVTQVMRDEIAAAHQAALERIEELKAVDTAREIRLHYLADAICQCSKRTLEKYADHIAQISIFDLAWLRKHRPGEYITWLEHNRAIATTECDIQQPVAIEQPQTVTASM